MAYVLTATVSADIETAEKRMRGALQVHGFGVLTEIDLAGTLKAKLDHDMPAYKILGACSPPLAKKAVTADVHIGALLPCNVVLRDVGGGKTEIAIADPEMMLSVANSPELNDLACDAKERLAKALADATS